MSSHQCWLIPPLSSAAVVGGLRVLFVRRKDYDHAYYWSQSLVRRNNTRGLREIDIIDYHTYCCVLLVVLSSCRWIFFLERIIFYIFNIFCFLFFISALVLGRSSERPTPLDYSSLYSVAHSVHKNKASVSNSRGHPALTELICRRPWLTK